MYFEEAIMTKAKLDEIRAMMNDPKVISGEGLSNEENIRVIFAVGTFIEAYT